MTFQELGLMPLITAALEKQGYKTPTPIQRGAIPPALAGRDVLGCAQTGTGKTCAFAAPILQRLAQNPRPGARAIRALILTPTRELALQIQESFTDYGKGLPLRSAVMFGGVGQQPQVDAIRRGLDILSATPGRLLDLHGQGFLDFSKLEIFVLDEADRMLDMGFIHDVKRILKLLPQKKQTLFFSATMPPEVTELVNSLLHDPARVAVDPVSSPVEIIKQSLYFVDKGNKTALLASLLLTPEVKNALVFTRTKHGANKVVAELAKREIAAAAIHGNKSQTARQAALSGFKAGAVKVLVATDIAARGIDIEDLSHVFNYNLPDVAETYVHRIGRTGRAGNEGTAISFCEFGEKGDLKDIEKLLGKSLPVIETHDWPMQVFVAAPKEQRGQRQPRQERRPRQEARPKQEPKQRQEAGRVPAPAAKQSEKPVRQPKPQPRRDPAPPSGQETRPKVDLSRAFAGDKLMDATSRLLSSVRPAAESGGHDSQPQGRQTPPRQNNPRQKPPAKPAVPAQKTPRPQQSARVKQSPLAKQPAPAKQPARGRFRDRRGPMPVALRPSNQKDSTEQSTLVRPYYLTPED